MLLNCEFKTDSNECHYYKLRYVTLLSASLKAISDINLTGSKIIDMMVLSTHKYLLQTYVSIDKVVSIYEYWLDEIFKNVRTHAYEDKSMDYIEFIESKFKLLSNDLVNDENEYCVYINDIYKIVKDILIKDTEKLIIPKDNGDFEIAIRQITKIVINNLRLFSILVMSLDRVYQYVNNNYGKPLIIVNSYLMRRDILDILSKFFDLIFKNLNVRNIYFSIDEDLVKNRSVVLSIDEIINFITHQYDVKVDILY